MEFPWYSNISWYGNLFELFGAIFGVLQYLGADKLADLVMHVNIWRKENFVTVGVVKFPIDQSLMKWKDQVKTLQIFLIETIRKYWKSYIGIALALLSITWGIAEALIYFGVNVSGRIILWINISIGFVFTLPVTIYILISFLFVIFVVMSAFLQGVVYLALYPVLFVLKYTSKYRDTLIIASVFIVILGLAMQVISPILQSENFVNWLNINLNGK